MQSKELQKLEQAVINLVLSSAIVLENHWEDKKNVSFKQKFERVTKFDPIIEESIREKLSKLIPDSGFYVEEGSNTKEKEYMWAIDPIDGTNNFIGNIPIFFIQIALVHNSLPVLGVIYNPVSKQMFSASKGNGARVNGEKIKEMTNQTLEKAIVDIDFGGNNGNIDWKLKVYKALAERCHRVRASGGSYGPYIIFGGIDAFLVLNETTKIVDQMPRIIFMQEAGLEVEKFLVEGYEVILTSNKILFPQLKNLIETSFT